MFNLIRDKISVGLNRYWSNCIKVSSLICVLSAVMSMGVGCNSLTNTQLKRGGGGDRELGAVASPLTTQLLDAAELASVNSIRIDLPTFPNSESHIALSPADAGAVVERIAREQMTLKVLGASSRGRNLGGKDVIPSADAVLRTEVLRFDKRQGSAIGGEPAVVSFRMSLESLKGRRAPIWKAQYFLKQEAVSENLLRLRERVGPSGLGAGWRSADDVFERGVNEALANVNSYREKQFLVGDRY